MWRKTLRRCLLLLVLRQVSGVKMRTVEFKDSLSPSATRNTGARWHPRSRAEDVLCKKGFLSAGNLTDTAIGLAVDEKQLISWTRTNQPKKKTDMSVSKLKQEVARSDYDARFPAADRNRVASIENCVAHLFTHLDRGPRLKSLGHSQDLLP